MKKKFKIVLNILVFLIYYILPILLSYYFKLFNVKLTNLSDIMIFIVLISLDLLPFLFLTIVYRKDFKNDYLNYKNNFINNIDKYVWLWIFALVVMSLSNILISLISGSDVSNNEQAIRNITKLFPIYSIISTSLLAPITEELAYRKTIRNIFINKKLSIIMSGIIFGLAHVVGTYTNLVDLLYIIPYGVFGSVFMYIYFDSDSIFSTITIHLIHNTLLVIMLFLR